MLKQRKGFTLIELLIVIVIIGILAAIAIPKFGKTREKAYFKSMQSDLRNLQAQQELYFSVPTNNYTYSNAISATQLQDFVSSQGVTVYMGAADSQGWLATAAHAALASTQWCGIAVGAAAIPTGLPTNATVGIAACTGDN